MFAVSSSANSAGGDSPLPVRFSRSESQNSSEESIVGPAKIRLKPARAGA
jgi:hypothetical protein